MNIKKSIAIIFAIIGLASCQKDSLDNQDVLNANLQTSLQKKYDFKGQKLTAGQIHNSILSEVINQTENTRNGNISQDCSTVLNYLENSYNVQFQETNLSFNSQLNYFNNNSNYSQSFNGLVNNMASDLEFATTYDDIQEIISDYNSKLNKQNLSDFEYDQFMNSLSVLKESSEFWYNGEGAILINNSQNRNDYDCGAVIAGGDWVGAVAGAATGGPAFVISGLVGAAAGSAYSWLTTDDCWENQE